MLKLCMNRSLARCCAAPAEIVAVDFLQQIYIEPGITQRTVFTGEFSHFTDSSSDKSLCQCQFLVFSPEKTRHFHHQPA